MFHHHQIHWWGHSGVLFCHVIGESVWWWYKRDGSRNIIGSEAQHQACWSCLRQSFCTHRCNWETRKKEINNKNRVIRPLRVPLLQVRLHQRTRKFDRHWTRTWTRTRHTCNQKIDRSLSSQTITQARRRKSENKRPHQKQLLHRKDPRDKTTDCYSGRGQPISTACTKQPWPRRNNSTIRTQIAECEVAYYKIRHTNPVLAEVDMDFYHSLPPVQVLLGEMTRLESLAMKLEANNIKPTSNTTICTTATRSQPTIHTDTDTMSKTEYNNNKNNNNNNKTNDNCTKANDDKRIVEQARETKRHHKQAIERERESKHGTATTTNEWDPKRASGRLTKKRRERQHGVDVKQHDWN